MRRAVDISASPQALQCELIALPRPQYRRDRPAIVSIPTAPKYRHAAVIGSRSGLRKNPFDRGARIGLQGRGQIDLLLALDADTLERELRHIDGRRRIKAHLGADAVVGRRIELRAE